MSMKKLDMNMAIILAVILLMPCLGLGAGKEKGKTGQEEFQTNCAACHPDGGNVIKPDKPMKGSEKLADFKAFQAWIRKPVPPMTPFTTAQISDKQVRVLYDYILMASKKVWK